MKSEKSQKKGNKAGKAKKSTATREAENPPEREEAMRAAGCPMTKAEQRHQYEQAEIKKKFEMSDEEIWYKWAYRLKYDEKKKCFDYVSYGSPEDVYWTEMELHKFEERGLHKKTREKREKSREESDALARDLTAILDEKGQDGLEKYLGGERQDIAKKNDVFLLRFQDKFSVLVKKRETDRMEINWNASEIDELKHMIGMFSDVKVTMDGEEVKVMKDGKDRVPRFVAQMALFTARAMCRYGMKMEDVFRAIREEGERIINKDVVFSDEEVDDIFDREASQSSPYREYKKILKEKWAKSYERARVSEELRKAFQM